MNHPHPLQFLAFASLAIAIVIIARDRAFSEHMLDPAAILIVKSQEPIVQIAGRKGTRNYRLDASTTPQKTEGLLDAAISAPTSTLEACMETWDRDTHITKNRWREICKRQIKEQEAVRER